PPPPPPPPPPTLLPYTTLFRSTPQAGNDQNHSPPSMTALHGFLLIAFARVGYCSRPQRRHRGGDCIGDGDSTPHRSEPQIQRGRSEEHTSELQSRSDLVCRLLL